MTDYKAKVMVLFVLLIVRGGGALESEIIAPPSSLNATLGSLATFHCGVILTYTVIWKVNGLFQDDIALDQHHLDVSTTPADSVTGIVNSTLTLPATVVNNGSIIRCVVAYPIIESDEVSLLVQGLLHPPTLNEPIEYNSSHQMFTWTGPFSLDITDLDPDITYRVCNNATSICVDTTDNSHVFPTLHSSTNYSVSACNPVGCSEKSVAVFSGIHLKLGDSELVSPMPVATPLSNAVDVSTVIGSSVMISSTVNKSEDARNLNSQHKDTKSVTLFAVVGGSVAALLVATGAITISLIAIYIRCRSKRACRPAHVSEETVNQTTGSNIQTRCNSAYVSHQLRHHKIEVERCPAYVYLSRHTETT